LDIAQSELDCVDVFFLQHRLACYMGLGFSFTLLVYTCAFSKRRALINNGFAGFFIPSQPGSMLFFISLRVLSLGLQRHLSQYRATSIFLKQVTTKLLDYTLLFLLRKRHTSGADVFET
jgi:hypothetical protein